MTGGPIIYCADVIARYEWGIIVVERLHGVKGLALPGGKQESGETLTETARREFREETGMNFIFGDILRISAEEGRDPRGRYVSAVLLGSAYGIPRSEPGKTRVFCFDRKIFEKRRSEFVFDHASILGDYFKQLG